MRPSHSLRPAWQAWRHTQRKPTISTTSSTTIKSTTTTRTITTRPGTFANIKYELLSRPPKTYYDYLTPTSSHLLNVTLADQLSPPSRPYPYPPPTTSDLDHWTLTRIQKPPKPAAPLPLGHHLVYFPPTHPTSALLPDGTDADHWPGAPFVRRLWAGGSVHFAAPGEEQQPLCLDGGRAVCVERVEDVRLTWARHHHHAPAGDEAVVGGGGQRDVADDKVFVDIVRHYGSVHEEDGDAGAGHSDEAMVKRVMANPTITERRTLVFLTAPGGGKGDEENKPSSPSRKNKESTITTKPDTTPNEIAHEILLTPSPALLFRFSALTFNAHAIHLDPAHSTGPAEGHRARLVHGPLLLVLMLSALRGALEGTGLAAAGLEYRNLEPLYVGEELRVRVARGRTRWNVWVEGPGGRLCVKGSAQVA
ncbi:hypothetical protein VMCG_00800 [Cytospora schulzeri]|uniref:MaoC-like domain-containing protein n=1 Tax=Cytospora schulzeri TaxID=448051 RepID=A0A423X9G0_9PEZI|nr:hypothetical protein VMCG_00800 [Valsa malicola]